MYIYKNRNRGFSGVALVLAMLSMIVGTVTFFYFISIESSEIYQSSESQDQIALSITKGINFLEASQKSDGSFTLYLCDNTQPERCDPINSGPSTAGVIYTIESLEADPRIVSIKDKALKFISATMETTPDGKHGVWNLFAPNDQRYGRVPADIDGTAVISRLLIDNNIPFPNDIVSLHQYRNEAGLYYNWISDEWNATEKDRHAFAGGSADDFSNPHYYGVDCVVNADVLSYVTKVGDGEEEICKYINDIIQKKHYPQCAFYYRNPYIIFSSIMHAYDKGAECLAPSVELVQSALLQSIQDDGRWSSNELSNIIAVSTLIKTGYSGHEVDKAIEHIIKRQDDDGGWENAIAFPDLYNPVFYGSRELVTASALQALYLFNRSN